MEKKPNIGFDIDNVVIDFANAFLWIAKNKFGILKNVKFSDITRYHFYECLDVSYEKCFEVVDYVLYNPFECNMNAVEGAAKTLTELSKDIDLIFVTARYEESKQVTKKLIYDILPDVDKSKITIIHQRGSEKYKILKKLGIEHFVDDRSRNARILDQNGVKVRLLNRPWNAKTRSDDFFTRIDTWKEIGNLVKEIHNDKVN